MQSQNQMRQISKISTWMLTYSAPKAQSGEHWIAELTGSESPVRAASAFAVCSWLGLPAVGGSGRAQGKLTSVERGGPCPAIRARWTFVSKSCRLPGFSRSDCRDQDLRNKLCLARILASQISPFKRYGLNLLKKILDCFSFFFTKNIYFFYFFNQKFTNFRKNEEHVC